MNEKEAAPVEATMPDGREIVAATMKINYEADLTMEDGEVVTVRGTLDADGAGVFAITKESDDAGYSALTQESEVHSMLDTFIKLATKAKKRPVLGGCATGCSCTSPVNAR